MLLNLTLHDVALAESVDIDFSAGLTVITGETGAGKSILILALSACLGHRADTGIVRVSQAKADISASFSLDDSAELIAWLHERTLIETPQDTLIIRRTIWAEGRSRAWINGTPVSIGELKELGGLLVHIHSQHSQQLLFHPHFSRTWLDQVAQLDTLSIQVASAHEQWQQLKRTQQKLLAEQQHYAARADELTITIDELSHICQYDYAVLDREYDALSNFETIAQTGAQMLDIFDTEDNSLPAQLHQLIKQAEQQSNQPVFATLTDHLYTAQAELDEVQHTLRDFIDQQQYDPERLQLLDQLLQDFHRLARKYKIVPNELTALLERSQQELIDIQSFSDIDQLSAQVTQLEHTFSALAKTLDDARKHESLGVAGRLTQLVSQLSLPEARFEFVFTALDAPQSIGLSQIDLLFSANKGIPLQSLAKIASGGELSRISLAMQLTNSQHMSRHLMVFDEIDVGISGGTAEIVGKMLRKLGRHQQVLSITHQPQVAALGDHHLFAQKIQSDPAMSSVSLLNEDARILELARMSGGTAITNTTLEHARALRKIAFDHSEPSVS